MICSIIGVAENFTAVEERERCLRDVDGKKKAQSELKLGQRTILKGER